MGTHVTIGAPQGQPSSFVALQQFSVHAWPEAPAVAFGEYHPYRVYGEKNPKFDRYSGMLLDLKNPAEAGHKRAVEFFAGLLLTHLNAEFHDLPAEFVVVPGHKEGKRSVGLESVLGIVTRAHRGFSHRPGALARTRTIEKLSTGGDRSVAVHMASLKFHDHARTPTAKVLVDDIATTCNSLVASVNKIRQERQGARVHCVVLGRTSHD